MKEDKLFAVKRKLFYEGFTQNNYAIVKELLEAHPELLNVSIEAIDPEDYDYDEDDGQTPLLSAIAFSDYEMFRMLIEDFKVDVNIGDYDGVTALWKLSMIDKKDRMYWVDLLLKYGVDIHTHTYTGMTPLMLAAKEGYIEMVEKLIDLGINVSFQDNDGDNVFHWMGMAYDGERDEELIDKIVQILLQSGIDIYARDKQGYSALDLAQKYNRPVVEKILQKYIKKEKEPILIHLKSNQLAPKTGRYQATLKKEHPQAEFLKSSGFDIKNVQENQSIGTFGLSEEDEDDIVWVYLGV